MRKTLFMVLVVGILSTALAAPALAGPAGTPGETQGRSGTTLEVTVLSTGETFDSIVTADLPAHGRFQQLVPTPSGDLVTAYGPGDVGYLGGRWWLDVTGDGEMNDGDAFFLCPLLGPGR